MTYQSDIRRVRKMRRRRTGASGAHTSSKPVIFWDQSRNSYVIKTPSNEAYKNELRVLCFTATYLGSTEKAWSVNESEIETAKTIVAGYFGHFDFIPKPESNFNLGANNLESAASAALQIFKTAGKDASGKAFRALSMSYHPDINKAPGANETMAELNHAWDKLKKELGW